VFVYLIEQQYGSVTGGYFASSILALFRYKRELCFSEIQLATGVDIDMLSV
jgi:hypothetical protein